MSDPNVTRRPKLTLDRLESRELLNASPWQVEPFQKAADNGLPVGWSHWSSDENGSFRVNSVAGGLGDQGRLESTASSTTSSRAWLSTSVDADVMTSAAVYLNSPAPVHLLIRGQELNTARPTYYAAAISRGAEVQLLKVVDGVTSVLSTVKAREYVSNKWATVTVRAGGDDIRISLHRSDTNQYLDSGGNWRHQPTTVIQVEDGSIREGGRVGFARPARAAGKVVLDSMRVGPVEQTTPDLVAEERFDYSDDSGLPAGWSQWSSPAHASFRTYSDATLRLNANSDSIARAWVDTATGANTQVTASVFVDSLVQAGIFARGSDLDTARPTYYAASVTRGLEVKLWKVVDGVATALETVRSQDWISGLWVQTSLVTAGDKLGVQIFRSDTGQYLKQDGTWSLAPAYALTTSDRSIAGGGHAGLSRGTGYAGELVFDNFVLTAAPGEKPTSIPTSDDKPTAPRPPGDDLPGTATDAPPVTKPVTATPEPSVRPSANGLPEVGRHRDWIRLANLAYYGTPMSEFEQKMLREDIDLVIPNMAYLDQISSINPETPQFVYTNVSNIYLNLLTDWNAYADRHGLDREGAFYHVNRATSYNGMSASAKPVNQFWSVYHGSGSDWKNVTRSAQENNASMEFGAAGEAVAFGFIEKFREVNVDLVKGAGAGWAAQLEYVAAVDDSGRPTEWKSLGTTADGTDGLRKDGRLTFNPPRDWVAASIDGGARLFYVRFRTTGGGGAPVAKSVLGRDYTEGGKIPAFDYEADRDQDGYLSDEEWAARRDGFEARFEYEGRLFYPNYGPLRFASNVSDEGFRAWSSEYHARFGASQSKVRGFFVDNSIGRLAVDASGLHESLEGYSGAYGSLLGSINKRLSAGGQWLIANTVGGNSTAEPVVRNGVSYLEEFALRPMAANHVQFDDLSATLRYRRQISDGKAYEILDTLPTNGDPEGARMQIASLAMYYAIADPDVSMLMVNGGNEPATTWKRHWIEAVTFDVGRPLGKHMVVDSGKDPADPSLAYKVYGRQYENALVLYKPLSYTRGQNGGLGQETATTHKLDGWYQVVNADGSKGERVNQVTLKNGEGAILARAA